MMARAGRGGMDNVDMSPRRRSRAAPGPLRAALQLAHRRHPVRGHPRGEYFLKPHLKHNEGGQITRLDCAFSQECGTTLIEQLVTFQITKNSFFYNT